MASRKSEPRGMAPCTCARIGYALFLCQEHAPIPYELTDKGRRDVKKLRQWDAIKGTLAENGSPRTKRLLKASENW